METNATPDSSSSTTATRTRTTTGLGGEDRSSAGRRGPVYVEPDGGDVERPVNWVAPEPHLFRPRQDRLFDILSGSMGSLLRGGSGAFVAGYRVRVKKQGETSTSPPSSSRDEPSSSEYQRSTTKDLGDQIQETIYSKIEESSSFLPVSRPSPGTLKLYEFEACPFCRKVREAVTQLDLDVLMFPCPKGGERYRPFVQRHGGKAMFPYLIDENTGFEGYESDEIVRYLFQTYGDGRVPLSLSLGAVTTLSLGLASLTRSGRGARKAGVCAIPKYPLELWAYEASPFSKIVRERIVEYELPHVLHSSARGSVNRRVLQHLTGRVQVPYLMDPNTGVSMFESAFIVDYLDDTYGPNSQNAKKRLRGSTMRKEAQKDSSWQGSTGARATMTTETSTTAPTSTSMNPDVSPKDENLEKYCSDPQNMDADECRIYDD